MGLFDNLKQRLSKNNNNNNNELDFNFVDSNNNNNNNNNNNTSYPLTKTKANNNFQVSPEFASEYFEPSNSRSAVALGLSAFVASTAQNFANFPAIASSSVAKGVSASALNTAIGVGFGVLVTPIAAALMAGFIDYQLQLKKLESELGRKLTQSPEDKALKNKVWNESSLPLLKKMGAAFLGAHVFTTIMQETNLAEIIASSMCHLEGSMPWQIDMVMMIASGVGLSLFLTAATIYQNKQDGKPTSKSEIVATLLTGLLVGMGAYAAGMIPGMNKTHGWGMPTWAAKVVAGATCGAVVTALFSLMPTMTKKLEKAGDAVSKTCTQWKDNLAESLNEKKGLISKLTSSSTSSLDNSDQLNPVQQKVALKVQ